MAYAWKLVQRKRRYRDRNVSAVLRCTLFCQSNARCRGTANFGILEARFPANVTHISQVLYGSIGYSVGALQGAALACKEDEPDRRAILFVGDGSLQLTVQEIATMIRHKLKPTM